MFVEEEVYVPLVLLLLVLFWGGLEVELLEV
jgi:hypothetical protein